MNCFSQMDGILIPYNDDCQNIIEMGGLKKANVKKDEKNGITRWPSSS